MVEPYTNTTINTIEDLDEDTVEEHTRANTMLNTKTNTRKKEVLEEEPWLKSPPSSEKIKFTTTNHPEEAEEAEDAAQPNTRMDMRRQKDIATLAGIRCSQL